MQKNFENESEKKVSRRTVLFSLGSLGLIVAGCGNVSSGQANLAGLAGVIGNTRSQAKPGQTIVTYQDHFTGGISDAAWSPDGARVAVSGYQHSIDIFNSTNGSTTERLGLHGNNGTILSWASNGRYLASAGPAYSSDSAVKIWDVRAGRLVNTYSGHQAAVTFVAFSPDGKRVASSSVDRTVHVWDAVTFKPLYIYKVPDQNSVTRLAWSSDGSYIVSGVDGLASGYVNPTVRVWNSRNGHQLTSWSGNVNFLAWSPDNQLIASAEGRTLALRHAQTGRVYKTYTYATQILGVNWSSNGKRIVACGGSTQSLNNDGFAQVITLSTNAKLNYTGHRQAVLSVAFSPDNSRVVSTSLDNTAKVWAV